MSETSNIKKKRYPANRIRLHELLEKKERILQELQEEVEYLRVRVKQADASAINATAEMYNITPEQMAEIMQRLYGDQSNSLPGPPPDTFGSKEQAEAFKPDFLTMEEEDTLEDEDA